MLKKYALCVLMELNLMLPLFAETSFKPETAKIEDVVQLPSPGDVQLSGLLGERFLANQNERLMRVDEDTLLAGFRDRPGKQAWIGEHVGKFLHAASLTYANTRNPELGEKIDRVASELMKTQEADGYLGTYVPEKRFGLYKEADWDVWVHKYDLLGLLAVHQHTENKEALQASKRIGDLLIRTFGPGGKSIVSAGTHVGMAATSVLEPMVLLYRFTGEEKYLDFAKLIVEQAEASDGPRIIQSLMTTGSVQKTANAKAYEMLSNLSGLCELHRATGDKRYLDPVLIAWDDIVKNRLYLTGSGSSFEYWQEAGKLPNGNAAEICETCVTVSWEQLNLQLFRLTGEAKYGDQLEKTTYNHLLAAQRPDGHAWCYYTPLEGKKPYGSSVNCCLSSGPRGIALLPTLGFGTTSKGVILNLFEPSRGRLKVPGGSIELEHKSDFPSSGRGEISILSREGVKGTKFGLAVRLGRSFEGIWINDERAEAEAVRDDGSPWILPESKAGEPIEISINGSPIKNSPKESFAWVFSDWKAGDKLRYERKMGVWPVVGEHSNTGRYGYAYGPIVLAADRLRNPGFLRPSGVELADSLNDVTRVANPAGKSAELLFRTYAFIRKGNAPLAKQPIHLVPFYEAGADGGPFVVWMERHVANERPISDESLLSFAEESRSRNGNVDGEIADADLTTFVVTFDGKRADEDWYAVDLDAAVTISRVVFSHGRSFHNGGWFDASSGKPRIQIRRSNGGEWKDLAVLEDYPNTISEKDPGLEPRQTFSVGFAPTEVWGVRVLGKPASGDDPSQNFSSCAEIQGYLDVP